MILRSLSTLAVGLTCLAAYASPRTRTLAAPQSASPRVIHITAERFSFTPSEIRVQAGEQVELRIRSEDTAHGFRIIGTNISGIVPKRGKGELIVVFRAENAGRYTFECSRMCGAGHDFMRGVLIVREPAK